MRNYKNEVRLKYNFFSDPTIKMLLSKSNGSELIITTLKFALGAKERIEGDKYFNNTLFTSIEDMVIIYGKKGYIIKRFWMKSDRNRSSKEYKNWRVAVFERDNYTCQCCEIKGVKLNAHHIERWVDCVDKRYDISNGKTLCEKCHRELHKNKNSENKLKGDDK